MRETEKEIQQYLQEAYGYILKLEQIALNQNSASIRVHLDLLIEKMKEIGHFEKVKKLEEIRERMDKTKGLKEVVGYMRRNICNNKQQLICLFDKIRALKKRNNCDKFDHYVDLHVE